MSQPIRLRVLPAYLAVHGLEAWVNDKEVSVLGYRSVLCVKAHQAIAFGDRKWPDLFMSFVQVKSQPVLGDVVIDAARAFAVEWFSALDEPPF